jgi:hypothetical protein
MTRTENALDLDLSALVDRRSVLAAGVGLLGGSVLRTPLVGAEVDSQAAAKLLDIHVHRFGIGEGGTGCRLSKSITDGLQFRALVFTLGLRKQGTTLDESYEKVLARQLKSSGLNRAAIVAQDAVYDANGKPDWKRTSFYVPNDYVFQVVKRHAEIMIACPSINPDRRDALDEVVRCHEQGARLFKIHPPTQGVDVSAKKHQPFFQKCADLGIVVLVHTGHEHSAPVLDKMLASPDRLKPLLDQGCTVVACHAGTGWPSDNPDQLPEFLALLKRYPRLWGDTAVLGTPGRVRDFARLLENPLAKSRLLHGSDFPFPTAPQAFVKNIGDKVARRLNLEPNTLKKDLELKEALGIGNASAARGFKLILGQS